MIISKLDSKRMSIGDSSCTELKCTDSQDGLSDNPREIFGFMAAEGIKNIVVAGVHVDECILKRPYGARGLRRAGFNVVLARDFTDALYDPR